MLKFLASIRVYINYSIHRLFMLINFGHIANSFLFTSLIWCSLRYFISWYIYIFISSDNSKITLIIFYINLCYPFKIFHSMPSINLRENVFVCLIFCQNHIEMLSTCLIVHLLSENSFVTLQSRKNTSRMHIWKIYFKKILSFTSQKYVFVFIHNEKKIKLPLLSIFLT